MATTQKAVSSLAPAAVDPKGSKRADYDDFNDTIEYSLLAAGVIAMLAKFRCEGGGWQLPSNGVLEMHRQAS
jgi:hypothetical protein